MIANIEQPGGNGPPPAKRGRGRPPGTKNQSKGRLQSRPSALESLQRATNGISMANYPAIIAGFMSKGIPEAEILPRENVFTFHAWKAKRRHVRKGEHGVRVITVITTGGEESVDPDTGDVRISGARSRPWSTVVFHVSQTEGNGTEGANGTNAETTEPTPTPPPTPPASTEAEIEADRIRALCKGLTSGGRGFILPEVKKPQMNTDEHRLPAPVTEGPVSPSEPATLQPATCNPPSPAAGKPPLQPARPAWQTMWKKK